jgi:F-box associated protein
MSVVDKIFSLPPEVKLMIFYNLSHSEGRAFFAVCKVWHESLEHVDFWKHRLLVDFALYAGDQVPSADLLNHQTIEKINRFFQIYTESTPLTKESVVGLYRPLSEEDLEEGFYSAYKRTYLFKETVTCQMFWISFLITEGANQITNQWMRDVGVSQLPNDIEISRRFYRLTAIFVPDLKSGIKSARSKLDELKSSLEQEIARRKREKYLRIFLYAVGALIILFGLIKLKSRLKQL